MLTDLEVIQMVDEALESMWKNEIKADYDKLQYYVETLSVGSKLYMATIWEYEDDESAWAEEDSSWIKGRVTELNVSYKRNADNELQFYVVRH